MRHLMVFGVVLVLAGCATRPVLRTTQRPCNPLSLAALPTDHLYYLDGVRLSREDMPVEDIENIGITRGATAVERYGPDAANGVILFVTRYIRATGT